MSSRCKTSFHRNSDKLTAVTTASCGILLLSVEKRNTFSDGEEFIKPSVGTVTVCLDDEITEGSCIRNIPSSRSAVR
jgi:hypothetical protein